MTPLASEIRLLLDLYLDGELDAGDRARAEALLASNAVAQRYVANVRVVGELFRADLQAAESAMFWEGLADRAWLAATDGGRDAELEMLAMALVEGAPLDADDRARAEGYLQQQPAARQAIEGLPVMAAIARAAAESAVARADFSRLHARLGAELDAADRARQATPAAAARPSFWTAFGAFVQRFQAPLSSLATAGLILGIGLPMLNSDDRDNKNTRPTVVNNYYLEAPDTGSLPTVQSVSFEPGYWAAVEPGDEEAGLAPIVWISAETAGIEGSSAPANDFDEPTPPARVPAKPMMGTLESGQSL
jgi:hypothetical protein